MNTKKAPLGIAIVGFGGMGSQHAKTLQSVEELKLIGTYDILNSRQEFARSLGFSPFETFESLLADPQVDIVLIATPNHIHKELSIRSMRAGKHVICEKPVTLNAAELEEILAVSHECNRVFVVHQNRRWDDDFRAVKQVFEDNLIGKIFTIESRVMGSQGIPGDWRTKQEFGGGMLLDWGIHLTDQMLWMVPEKVKRIYCKLGHLLGGECDDSVHLYLTFESGLQALIEVGTWNMEPLPRWYLAGINGAMTIKDFWFSESSITRLKNNVINNTKPIDAGKGITKTMAPRDPNTLEHLEPPHQKFDVCDYYRNVVGAIRGQCELIVKPEESLRVMKLMDAARLSAEQDCVLNFE